MTVAQDQELITVQEAAKRYKVNPATVYYWIDTGLITKYERKLPYRVFVDAREIDRAREIHPADDTGNP